MHLNKYFKWNNLKTTFSILIQREGSSEGEHYAEDVGVASSILAPPISGNRTRGSVNLKGDILA